MERGYLRASVPDSVRLDSTGRRGSIFFTIDQGPLCLCGPVGIQGLKSIRPWVVTRELAFKPGDTLTSKKIQTSIRNLYTTGLFTFVTITPQGAEGAPRIGVAVTPVAVTIDEAKSLTLDASLGYGTVDAFRTALGIAYGNVWSLGHTVSLNTATSRFGQRAELGYSLPWIFSHPVRVDASAYIERHEFNYHGLFEGVRLSLAPQRTGPISSRLWVQYEKTVYIHTFNDTVVEPKNTRSVGLEFTFDGRRNFAKRKFGMLVNLFPEIAGLGGRSSYQYYRSTFNAHFYLAPTQGFEFSPSLSVGYARGYGGSAGSLPPQARSYIGTDGLAPVRGYAVSVNGGAFTLVATPLDARFSIYKWIGVNAFVDGGHEWPDFRSARVGDMRWTAGPGISMRISIAQLRVDFPLYLNGSRGFAPPWLSIENTF
jgi:outer membrane protein assembly factor BamA